MTEARTWEPDRERNIERAFRKMGLGTQAQRSRFIRQGGVETEIQGEPQYLTTVSDSSEPFYVEEDEN